VNEGHHFHKVLAAYSTNQLQSLAFMTNASSLKRGLTNPALFLLLAILLALGLSLIGLNWGRYQDWHFDQIAYIGIKPDGMAWLYLKPPLHTYLTEFLVIRPLHVLGGFFPANPADPNHWLAITILSGHLLAVLMFCGSVALLHRILVKSSGSGTAGVLALLMATSAGLIQFNHYGTADSPLLFWMLASFAMAMRLSRTGALRDAVLAGLLAGLAAADKYNGLGVAAAIPVVLLLRSGWRGLFGLPMILGSLAVPLGFFIGNPGCIFDRERFIQHFLYNLYTTPVYYGSTKKLGYLDFFGSFRELIGIPASIIVALGFVATLILLRKGALRTCEKVLIAAAGAVFLFYFLTIGGFPRMEDRFVLPVIPFALLLAAPALQRLPISRKLVYLPLLGVLAYNIFCSVELGRRFLADPRMDAQIFAMRNFPKGATVENTYAPDWNLLPGVSVKINSLKCDPGQKTRFTKIFGKNNKVISQGVDECGSHDAVELFSPEGLKQRNPDFVAFSSVTYGIAYDEPTKQYYRDLEAGRLGYRTVFHGHYRKAPDWIYPRQSDALMPEMVILQREN